MNWSPFVLAIIVLAGCTAAEEPVEPAVGSPEEPEAATSPGTSDAVPAVDGGVAAPDWRVGQAWTWRITSPYHPSFETATAVAAVDHASYRVGFGDEAGAFQSVWFHLPPAGIVQRENLAWEAHDQPVDFLQFPLRDGASWSGELEGSAIDVTARSVDGVRFDIEALYEDSEWVAMSAVYDASIGQFRSIHMLYGGDTPMVSAELVGSVPAEEETSSGDELSPGADGTVYVPHADDLFMGDFSSDPQYFRGPAEFDVPAGVQFIVIGCLVPNDPAYSAIHVVPSMGDPATCERSAAEAGMTMTVQSRAASSGTWRIVPTVLGTGWVFVEVAGVVLEEVAI